MDSELISHVVDELFQAFETKNKELGMEALRALILHIQDEDKEQDKGEPV